MKKIIFWRANKTMEDMFKAYEKTVCDVICEAMENQDYEILRGIQSFDLSPWMGLRGVEIIITVIVDLTIASNPFRFNLDSDVEQTYKELGIYDRIKERFDLESEGKIPYEILRYILGELKNKRNKLEGLAEKGLINIEPSGKIVSDNCLISLTEIWNPLLERIINDEIEPRLFISSLGKMVALGVGEKGIRFIKPIINALNRSENNDGEILLEDFLNIYLDMGLPYYYFPISIRTDEKKSEAIRLIAYKNNEKVIFNRHSIRALQEWRRAARNYVLETRRERRGF